MNRLSKVLSLTALSAALISSAAFADNSRRHDDDRNGQYRQDDDDRYERDGYSERKQKNRNDKVGRSYQYISRDQAQSQRYGGDDYSQVQPRYSYDDSGNRGYQSRDRIQYQRYGNTGRNERDNNGRYVDYNRSYYGYNNPRYNNFDYRAAQYWSRQNNYYGFRPLPPGIRMNMARGMRVPYGISYRSLPPQYVGYLPRYRGYEWRGYGTDLVLVGVGTAIIAEVIRDALG